MAHDVSIFVGERLALRPFFDVAPSARAYALTPSALLFALPFDDPVEAQLQRRFGVGDWPEDQAMMLSTSMQRFAADCSRAAPLGYIETHFESGGGQQTAVLWQGGLTAIGPATLNISNQGSARAPSLWPVNAVLRALGVRPSSSEDEFTAFGLSALHDNAAIHAHGQRVHF